MSGVELMDMSGKGMDGNNISLGMENSKDVTIYDIAKNLRVSPSTVSRALNDDPTVSKKTRKRIFDTASEMGYRSNPYAKNLRQQQSLTIGVIVSELNNGIMTPVLSGIETVANEAGYGIIIMDSSQRVSKEADIAQSLFHRRVDGLIAFLAPDTSNLDHFSPFIEKNIPLIFLDRAMHIAGTTSVVIDNMSCGVLATQHLIKQGCSRIAYVTSSVESDTYALRYSGYLSALKSGGLPFDGSLVITGELTEDGAAIVAEKLMKLDPLPDGLFVTSDLAAAVCIRMFTERGLRVPEDIAVVGFNNEIIGKLIRPTLTTVNYPGREIGEAAALHLVDHLKGGGKMQNISTLTIRAGLVVRESSIKVPGASPRPSR